MAKLHAGPTPRQSTPESPERYSAWRQEFLTRSSWGRPAAHHANYPEREWHQENLGPSVKQGHHVEHHPGDD